MMYPLRNTKKIMLKRAMVQCLRKRPDREIRKYMVSYSGDLLKILGALQVNVLSGVYYF
jgi:hypothetical protein